MSRQMYFVVLAMAATGLCGGCSNVDWNYDVSWWKPAKRIVRPDPMPYSQARVVQVEPAPVPPAQPESVESPTSTAHPQPQSISPTREVTDGGTMIEESPIYEPAPSNTAQVSTPLPQATSSPPAEPKAAERIASREESVVMDEPVESPPPSQAPMASPSPSPPTVTGTPTRPPSVTRRNAPFHRLCLYSGAKGSEVQRDEPTLKLANVKARTCATVLEMLYIPLGRSGSDDDSYLLFEDSREVESAGRFAPSLDVPALSADASPVGAEQALRTGIGLYFGLLEKGPVVDPAQAEACEKRLAEALQGSGLDGTRRWAAGMLAGRVASEYRYDYATAKSYYQQAERIAPPRSQEQMTSLWWQADALAMEGKRREAVALYRTIIDEYGAQSPGSQIVRRSEALMAKLSKG